jgi:hypothetical protein
MLCTMDQDDSPQSVSKTDQDCTSFLTILPARMDGYVKEIDKGEKCVEKSYLKSKLPGQSK